jgi:hypothetical protein
MKYSPYNWQIPGIEHATEFLLTAARGSRQFYTAPTGCGKSVMELCVQQKLFEAGHEHSWITTPREEIIYGMLDKLDVADRSFESAYSRKITTPIRMRNRLLKGEGEPPHKMIIDEAHHDAAESYRQVELLSGLAPRVGFSASPFRGSPRSTQQLRELWGDPIQIITYEEAERIGAISMPEYKMLPLLDDDQVELKNGEFVVEAIEDATKDRIEILIDHALKNWKDGPLWDRPTIFSLPSSALCHALAERFQRAGLAIGVVSAETPKALRYQIFQGCLERICAIAHINVVTEGVDLKLERLVDLSPVMSPVKWLQQLGRITRPQPRKPEYVCVAEGTPILTNSGWKPIESIELNDLVWDGVEFVDHDGVVCNGEREVTEVYGVSLTPDHEVLTTEGWKQACQLDNTKKLNLGKRSLTGQLFVSSVFDADSGHVNAYDAEQNEKFLNDFSIDFRKQCVGNVIAVDRSVDQRESIQNFPFGSIQDSLPQSITLLQEHKKRDGKFIKSGSKTKRNSLSILLHSKDTTTKTLNLIGATTHRDTCQETYDSLPIAKTVSIKGQRKILRGDGFSTNVFKTRSENCIGSFGNPENEAHYTSSQNSIVCQKASSEVLSVVKVYDILNCGPRRRFQAGPLILHNCTNKNLLRHAYLLDGVLPHEAVAEAEAKIGFCERGDRRVVGLENIGRFKPSRIKNVQGITCTVYALSVVVNNLVVEYAAIVHPAKEDPIWAVKMNTINEDRTRNYGKWQRADPPEDLRGFGSMPGKALSEKQAAWWTRSAANFGIDPTAKVDRKNFQVLPICVDLGVRLS